MAILSFPLIEVVSGTSQDPQELEGSEEDMGEMESNIPRQDEDVGSDVAAFWAQISENLGGGLVRFGPGPHYFP